jgi:hypothetical protein
MNYTLFNIVKHKTNIRGYWLADNGKLYKDNISLLYLDNDNLEDVKLDLFNRGELSIFYKDNHCAIIEDAQGKRIRLYSKQLLQVKKTAKLKSIFNKLLKAYKGFTLYKNEDKTYYTIEIWQA